MTLLDPNFNGLPKPTDWKKVIVPLQQANEKEFRGATLLELGDNLNIEMSINAQRVPSVPPGALPSGPPDLEVFMEIKEPGSWTWGTNPPLTNTQGDISTFWWDMTDWKKNDRVSLPVSPADGKVTPSDTKAVSGKETFEKTLTKQVYLSVDIIIGKNKFNKARFIADKVMNSLGNVISATGYGMAVIPVDIKSYIGSGAYSAGSSKRMGLFATESSTIPLQFHSGSYAFTPNQVGLLFVNIYDPTSNFLNTFQLEEGSQATAYEAYHEEVSEKIKQKYLPDPEPMENVVNEIDNVALIDQSIYTNNINSSGSGILRKTVHIPNSYGKVLKNVVVPITLINGANTESQDYDRFVFLDGNSKNDFSDVRFIKSGKVLPIELGESVNVKVQPFNFGLTSKEMQQSPLDGRYFCDYPTGVRVSSDLKNWTQLIPNEGFVFINKIGDIFTSLNNTLKKYKASENFSTGRVVITLPTSYSGIAWSGTRVTFDKFGNIYFGTYQGDFDARIWKSTDQGDSFTVVLGSDVNKSQHCHNIKCDTSVEPNILYASFDGATGGLATDMSQWQSKDYGVTWARNDISNTLGYQVDNGILYAQGDFLFGGSEGDAKACPNLYYSIDRGETWNIVEGGFQTFTAYPLKNYLVTQSIPRYNENVSKMVVFDKTGKYVTLVTRNLVSNPTTTGAGWRYGSTAMMKYQGKDCYLLVSGEATATLLPSLMVTSEAGEYTAQAMITIDELPIGGLDVEVHTGYSLPTYNQNLFVEKDALQPVLERKYQEVFQPPYPRHSAQLKDYTIFSDKKMKKLKDINLSSNLPATASYTVSMWITTKGYQPVLTAPLMEIFGNDLTPFSPNQTTLRFGNATFSAIFYGSGGYKSYMLTISVSNGSATVFVNQSQKGSAMSFTDAQLPGISMIGISQPDSIFISDLKIFNSELTLTDVRKLFSYNQMI